MLTLYLFCDSSLTLSYTQAIKISQQEHVDDTATTPAQLKFLKIPLVGGV